MVQSLVNHVPVLVILSESFCRTPTGLVHCVDVDDLGSALTYILEIIAVIPRSAACIGISDVFVRVVRHRVL
jgi:hypothetical protein